MKSRKKSVFVVIIFIVTVALIIINRHSTQQNIDMADKMQLSFSINNQQKIYYYDENHSAFKNFDTQMKRKNGDVSDKNYGGIPVAVIFDDMDIQLTENSQISIVCADQYEIQLTADEILAENNVWLITKENGEKLTESQGPFMLVIKDDEFSTRWARNVVGVKIK